MVQLGMHMHLTCQSRSGYSAAAMRFTPLLRLGATGRRLHLLSIRQSVFASIKYEQVPATVAAHPPPPPAQEHSQDEEHELWPECSSQSVGIVAVLDFLKVS